MPGSVIAQLLTLAKKNNNYDLDATAGGLWITDKIYKVTCPASKRLFLMGGVLNRAVSSTVVGSINAAGGEELHRLTDKSAATGITAYPEDAYQIGQPFILDATDYLQLSFGTSQNASSWATGVMLEVDV